MVAPRKKKRWSQRVTQTSNALDLEAGVFTLDDPRSIARSLKRSAQRSRRRKADPYRSAMSMLTFYINRAGKQLGKRQRKRLEAAKDELRARRRCGATRCRQQEEANSSGQPEEPCPRVAGPSPGGGRGRARRPPLSRVQPAF